LEANNSTIAQYLNAPVFPNIATSDYPETLSLYTLLYQNKFPNIYIVGQTKQSYEKKFYKGL